MATSQAGTGGTTQQGRQGQQGQAGMMQGGGAAGLDDVTYDIVSVIYHALQGAQTYQQYAQDAQRSNDQIAQFFHQICDENQRRAQQGLELLQQCLGGQALQGGRGSQQHMQGGQPSGQQGDQTSSGQHGRGMR